MQISRAPELDSATMDGSPATMIYRDLPNVRQVDAWNQFVEKTGRENVVVYGRTRFRQCEQEPSCMALRAVRNGSESLHFKDGRNLRLDDDCYLVLNGDSKYATRIAADEPVNLLTIYFRDGMVQEIYETFTRPLEALIENHKFISAGKLQFNEHLREHGGEVSQILDRLIAKVECSGNGNYDPFEDMVELLFGMIRSETTMQAAGDNLGLARRNTRQELFRRLHRARDFIHSNYEKNIGINEMAAHASISSCHFVRFFKKCFGITPHQYLCKKRSQVAERIIKARADMPLAEIAQIAGFENRQTLFRNLKKFTGQAPSLLRTP